MKIKTFDDLFASCIKDLYSAESQLVKALAKMAKNATSPELKQGFQQHLAETEKQKERLEQIAELLEISPKGKKCAAMEGLITEAEEVMSEIEDAELMDAALIVAAQKVEHYEISGYGSAATFAKLIGKANVLKLLLATLEEEKATDAKLTQVAEAMVNQRALATK